MPEVIGVIWFVASALVLMTFFVFQIRWARARLGRSWLVFGSTARTWARMFRADPERPQLETARKKAVWWFVAWVVVSWGGLFAIIAIGSLLQDG